MKGISRLLDVFFEDMARKKADWLKNKARRCRAAAAITQDGMMDIWMRHAMSLEREAAELEGTK